jgi:DNA-binding MarR family transcriptional regulator
MAKPISDSFNKRSVDPDRTSSVAQMDFPLGQSITHQLRVTLKEIEKALQAQLDRAGISLGTWYFLRALWEGDGITQRELSHRLSLVAPTTVQQLKSMEGRGLIKRRRSRDDRRCIHVFLTPKGKALRQKLLPLAPYITNIALQGLSESEIGLLRLILAKMQSNVQTL